MDYFYRHLHEQLTFALCMPFGKAPIEIERLKICVSTGHNISIRNLIGSICKPYDTTFTVLIDAIIRSLFHLHPLDPKNAVL